VHDWAAYRAWKERHEELVREAENRWLVRELREARDEERSGDGHTGLGDGGIEVRLGLLEDEAEIADLLELNGMPRWVAFEGRYIVAEKDGEILAVLRYRTESKRLLLGLLVSNPWVEERPLAVALYAGAGELAREMGVTEVLARSCTHGDYPHEAGYRRRGLREWRLDVVRRGEIREEPAVGMWQRLFGLLGATTAPFVGLVRKQG
jgi:hypothetical protein